MALGPQQPLLVVSFGSSWWAHLSYLPHTPSRCSCPLLTLPHLSPPCSLPASILLAPNEHRCLHCLRLLWQRTENWVASSLRLEAKSLKCRH